MIVKKLLRMEKVKGWKRETGEWKTEECTEGWKRFWGLGFRCWGKVVGRPILRYESYSQPATCN